MSVWPLHAAACATRHDAFYDYAESLTAKGPLILGGDIPPLFPGC